jgi:hypothetical protein
MLFFTFKKDVMLFFTAKNALDVLYLKVVKWK